MVSSVQNTLFQKSCDWCRCNFANISHFCFLEKQYFSPTTLSNKPCLFIFFWIEMSWTLIFNMLTYGFTVTNSLTWCSFSESHSRTVWLKGEFVKLSVAGKIGNYLEWFSLVTKLSHRKFCEPIHICPMFCSSKGRDVCLYVIIECRFLHTSHECKLHMHAQVEPISMETWNITKSRFCLIQSIAEDRRN